MLLNPCCCTTGTCANECCEGGKWPDQINCDIGTLGWTDVDCDACDTLGGMYVLDYSAADSGAGTCVWKYDSGVICTRTAPCGDEQQAQFQITAELNNECRWTVTLAFEMLGGDDACGSYRKIVQYRLSNTDEEDCDGMEIPFLATITSDNTVCSGSYNATIELSR